MLWVTGRFSWAVPGRKFGSRLTVTSASEGSPHNYKLASRDGEPNLSSELTSEQPLKQWFFVYFGYSKVERSAKGLLWTRYATHNVEFSKVNHFVAGRFYFSWSEQGLKGQVVKVTLTAGPGALISVNNFQERDNDCR
jgi:hypothetical protein